MMRAACSPRPRHFREITEVHRLGGTAFAMVRVFIHGGRAAEHMHQRMRIELARVDRTGLRSKKT